MLIMAACTFHAHGLVNVDAIEKAHLTLQPLLGSAAGTLFAIALLAAGLSSSAVGTMAGQVVMQGFLEFAHSALGAAGGHHGALRCWSLDWGSTRPGRWC